MKCSSRQGYSFSILGYSENKSLSRAGLESWRWAGPTSRKRREKWGTPQSPGPAHLIPRGMTDAGRLICRPPYFAKDAKLDGAPSGFVRQSLITRVLIPWGGLKFRDQNPHSNFAKSAELEWGTRLICEAWRWRPLASSLLVLALRPSPFWMPPNVGHRPSAAPNS